MPGRLVLVGLAAAATVAVLVRDAYAPVAPTLVYLLIAFAALGALVALEVRRPALDRRLVMAAGAGLLVAAVVVPPLQSRDLWSYAIYGRMVTHYHANPYRHVPAEWPSDPWTAHVAHGWRTTRSVYGPAFTALSAAGMATAGHGFLGARLFFQITAALAVAAAGWLVARRTAGAAPVALLVLNPLVVISVVNGGHNDALVGLAVLGGVLLAARHPVGAGAVLALAALVKAAAALPLLAVAYWLWRRHGRRPALRMLATAAVLGAVAYLLAGGLAALRPLRDAGLDFSGASIWYGPRRWLTKTLYGGRSAGAAGHLTRQLLSPVAAALVAGLAFVLARRRLRAATPAVVAGGAAFAYVLAGAYILPWYAYWGLPALALAWRSRLTWLAAVHGAVLYLAAVPDLTVRSGIDPHWVASPLQRLRADIYTVWVPILEGTIIAVVVAWSLWPRRNVLLRLGDDDVARGEADEHRPVVVAREGGGVG